MPALAADYPPLTPAQQRLVIDNQRFAFMLAYEQRRCGMPMPDVQQTAMLGLIYAAQRFDGEGHGTKFTTFSAWWIRACIWRAAADERHLVRLTTTQAKRRIVPWVQRLQREGHELKDLDPASVAADLGVPQEEVAEVLLRLQARTSDVRLDAGTGFALRVEPEAEARVGAQELHRALQGVIARISEDDPRMGIILRERFLRAERVTYRDLGTRLELSHERVRQIEARALELARTELVRGEMRP